jgi:hypothetical protein
MLYTSILPGLGSGQSSATQSCRSTFDVRRKPRDLPILLDYAVTVSSRRRRENQYVYDHNSHLGTY